MEQIENLFQESYQYKKHTINETTLKYCMKYVYENNITKEQLKEDFKFIRNFERNYMKLFNKFIKEDKIILSNKTNYYSINGYKKRGETGTIMAIRYLINNLEYEGLIDYFDIEKYKKLVKNYFNNNNKLWFEYNKYNIYKYSDYYMEWEYNRPEYKYIGYTDKLYYKIIKNIIV